MPTAANWTARLNELATRARVRGAALGIWSDGPRSPTPSPKNCSCGRRTPRARGSCCVRTTKSPGCRSASGSSATACPTSTWVAGSPLASG